MKIDHKTLDAARERTERYLAGLKFRLSPEDHLAAYRLCMLKQLVPDSNQVYEMALRKLFLEYCHD